MKRRSMLTATLSSLAGLNSARAANVVRMLLGFPAGASGDAMARALAQSLGGILGEPVIVESHPGADGRIALDRLRRSSPDGRSMLFTPLTPLTSAPWLYKLSYDPFRDLRPLAHVASFRHVLVVGSGVPADSLASLADLARKAPTPLFYSAASLGSSGHLAMAALLLKMKIELPFVPYQGTTHALTDLFSGRLTAFIGSIGDVVELVRAGRVRPIGTASESRSTHLPDVATFKEQGFDVAASGDFGVYAPAGTPFDVASRRAAAILESLRDPMVLRVADRLGLEPAGCGPECLARIQRAEFERAGERIATSGFTVGP